jgi:hypothetical protein
VNDSIEPSNLCTKLAPLNFVNVRIKGHHECIRSLVDRESEINLLRSDAISQLAVEPIGEVTFKGTVGSPVNAPLVRLPVQLYDEVTSVDEYIYVCDICCLSGCK